MARDLDTQLDEIQTLIRDGRLALARTRVLAISSRKRLPRPCLSRVAALARESFLFAEAVRLLRPRVRPAGRRAPTATEEEKAEYGMALAALGAGAEAIAVLESVDVTQNSKALFGLALAHFRQWDWESAIPLLEGFLGGHRRSSIERRNAQLDLGVALMHGKDEFDRSRVLLLDVLRQADSENHGPAVFEALTMLAQNRFYARDAKGGRPFLARLERARAEGQGVSLGLRVELLEAEYALLESPKGTAALAALHGIRRKLGDAGIWNRLRECDYGEFVCTGNRALLWRLYFGTPMPRARGKFLRLAGLGEADVPARYLWPVPLIGLPAQGAKPLPLHLLTGENGFSPNAKFKDGQVIARCLQALAKDLYAPASGPALFERLHPGDYFEQNSSMLRVRQSLFRLRSWLERHRIPLEVSENSGQYRLIASRPIELEIPSPQRLAQPLDGEASAALIGRMQAVDFRLRAHFGQTWFSATEVSPVLAVSNRSSVRYLKTGVEQGLFEARGGGRGRRYRIK